MIRLVVSAIVLGGCVVAPLAGCAAAPEAAAEAEPTATPVTTSPSPSANEGDPCDLLTADAAEALAGEPMTDSSPAAVGGLPACHLSGATRRIQVAQVPATEWAEVVPAMIDKVRSADGLSEAYQAKLDEMAARSDAGNYDALAACELFAAMAESNGMGPSRTLAYVPDGRAPQAISAQSCIDGTYTSLLLSGPDIVVSHDLEAAVAATLELMEAD